MFIQSLQLAKVVAPYFGYTAYGCALFLLIDVLMAVSNRMFPPLDVGGQCY